MAYVTANGVRLHVQRLAGSGPPLVFVHGMVDTLACFYFTLAGPVNALGFDVITYDLRGHGRSERTPTGYTLDDSVDDLHGLVTALGITEPVHLVGYSHGGAVMYRYAHRHPGRVTSMVMIESEPPTAAWAEHMLDAFRELEVFVGDPERMAEQPEIYQRMEASARTLNATTTAGADVVAPAGLLTPEEVAAIDVPTQFVVGGRSRLHTYLPTVLPMLPRCTVEVIPGHDHMLLVQAPQQVCAAMLPWLGSFVGTAAVS